MLGMGFVPAHDGDTENIPNQPVEEVEKWIDLDHKIYLKSISCENGDAPDE
jgi:hypothetical protein